MTISLFEIFKIGIGPSSSHTVGPMKAAFSFISLLKQQELLKLTQHLSVETYGSLALTGQGHGTDKAIILGLSGEQAHLIEADAVSRILEDTAENKSLFLDRDLRIEFDPAKHIIFKRRQRLPFHSNGMKFFARDAENNLLLEKIYYSVGGGFILSEDETDAPETGANQISLPFQFDSGKELLELGKEHHLSIPAMVMSNEKTLSPDIDIESGIEDLSRAMEACIDRGCNTNGILPGRLQVKRRAGQLYEKLTLAEKSNSDDPMRIMDWVNLWAIAVNEENAAGGQVVTAPTNGAAGILPAVLRYYRVYCKDFSKKGLYDFFLTATAIASLYKKMRPFPVLK